METFPDSSDFTSKMRVPGIQGIDQCCVHPDNSKIYVFDNIKDNFVVIDVIESNRRHAVEVKGQYAIKKRVCFVDSCCIERNSRTLLLAFFYDQDTKGYFFVVHELMAEANVAVVIEEHVLDLEKHSSHSFTCLIRDEHGDLYFIEYWCNDEQQTSFHVILIETDCTQTISHKILFRNQTIDNLYFIPFIFDRNITFFDFERPIKHAVSIHLEKGARKQYYAIAPHLANDLTNDDSDRYPPTVGMYSTPYLQNCIVYIYIFTMNRKTGKVWAMDLNYKQWRKCFTLKTHVIGKRATLVVKDDRLFLYGHCTDENCSDKSHLYHFGITWIEKLIFPSIEQLCALFSKTKTQVFYGPNNSGKTIALLLKAVQAIQSSGSSKRKIKIFATSNAKRNYIAEALFALVGATFNSKNICLWNETVIDGNELDGCDIFIHGLSSLSLKLKNFLFVRQEPAIITVIENSPFAVGFDYPRNHNFSWYLFKSRKNKNSVSSVPEEAFMQTGVVSFKSFIEYSSDALDQFYSDWWSSSRKDTIFIPACHDVFGNRYTGPTDICAAGFDQELFENRERYYRGQKAESDIMNRFKEFQIGGVFVSGFNSMELATKSKEHNVKFKKEFGEFEVDAIFIHPRCGIFVFEIKATEKEDFINDVIKKASRQIENMKQKLPIVFKKICNAKFAAPMYFVLCFPNTTMSKINNIENFSIFDKSKILEDKLKTFILSKMTLDSLSENETNSLKTFTAVLAGYRSLDFLSAGHNALTVCKMIDSQRFTKHDSCSNELGIFFTNEQLAILNCHHKYQIISGPPGTGKTLILLRKALAAARIWKKGTVSVLISRKELIIKFQKYFEAHNEGIVRFPVIHQGRGRMTGESQKAVKRSIIFPLCTYFQNHNPAFNLGYESHSNDDDVFADELYLSHFFMTDLLRKQLSSSGQTVLVFTGLLNPIEIRDVSQWLKEQNMPKFTHFEMKTVIRSSKNIFEVWKNEYHLNNYPLHLGHNINGPSVERSKFRNSNEILDKVLETIRRLFVISESSDANRKLSLKHLCIISDCGVTCLMIKDFLSNNLIPCGSVEEQIINQNIAAVSKYEDTLSHEWPIVIIVSIIDIAFPYYSFLIAASRCIAKLIIIERDLLNAMKEIDEKTNSQPVIEYNALWDTVVAVEREIGETETLLIFFDFTFHSIRRNLLVEESGTNFFSKGCCSLSDCWLRIADEPAICRHLLEQDKLVRKKFKRGIVPLSDKPSNLFIHITSEHLGEVEQLEYWKIFMRLVKSLYQIVKEEKNGCKSNAMETDQIKQISKELTDTNRQWEFLQYTVRYLIL